MPSSTALSTPRTASRSTARPYANHQNPASAASLTPTAPSEPLKPSTGELSAIIGMLSAIDRNQCPQSIGTPVRNPRNPHTSLSRPTGNLTGVTFFVGELLSKRLALLRELVPKADLVAVLQNPTNPNLPTRVQDMQAAARMTDAL